MGKRRVHRLVIASALAVVFLLPNDTVSAADWYPNGYYLHGHTDFDDPCATMPCMRSSAYSLTTNGYVWIGVYAAIADYCPTGGWSPTYEDGWHWILDWPDTYHRARIQAVAGTCTGHAYASTGGHNIHDDGLTPPVDFYGWTSGT